MTYIERYIDAHTYIKMNLVEQYFQLFLDPLQGIQEHHLPPYIKHHIVRVIQHKDIIEWKIVTVIPETIIT